MDGQWVMDMAGHIMVIAILTTVGDIHPMDGVTVEVIGQDITTVIGMDIMPVADITQVEDTILIMDILHLISHVAEVLVEVTFLVQVLGAQEVPVNLVQLTIRLLWPEVVELKPLEMIQKHIQPTGPE